MEKEILIFGKSNNELELIVRYYFDDVIRPLNQKVFEKMYQRYQQFFDKMEFFEYKNGIDFYLNVDEIKKIINIDNNVCFQFIKKIINHFSFSINNINSHSFIGQNQMNISFDLDNRIDILFDEKGNLIEEKLNEFINKFQFNFNIDNEIKSINYLCGLVNEGLFYDKYNVMIDFDKKNNLFDLIFKQLNKKIEWL